jgi:hypothetical protein
MKIEVIPKDDKTFMFDIEGTYGIRKAIIPDMKLDPEKRCDKIMKELLDEILMIVKVKFEINFKQRFK